MLIKVALRESMSTRVRYDALTTSPGKYPRLAKKDTSQHPQLGASKLKTYSVSKMLMPKSPLQPVTKKTSAGGKMMSTYTQS